MSGKGLGRAAQLALARGRAQRSTCSQRAAPGSPASPAPQAKAPTPTPWPRTWFSSCRPCGAATCRLSRMRRGSSSGVQALSSKAADRPSLPAGLGAPACRCACCCDDGAPCFCGCCCAACCACCAAAPAARCCSRPHCTAASRRRASQPCHRGDRASSVGRSKPAGSCQRVPAWKVGLAGSTGRMATARRRPPSSTSSSSTARACAQAGQRVRKQAGRSSFRWPDTRGSWMREAVLGGGGPARTAACAAGGCPAQRCPQPCLNAAPPGMPPPAQHAPRPARPWSRWRAAAAGPAARARRLRPAAPAAGRSCPGTLAWGDGWAALRRGESGRTGGRCGRQRRASSTAGEPGRCCPWAGQPAAGGPRPHNKAAGRTPGLQRFRELAARGVQRCGKRALAQAQRDEGGGQQRAALRACACARAGRCGPAVRRLWRRCWQQLACHG